MFNPQPKLIKQPKKKKGKKPFVDKRVEYRGVLMQPHTAIYYEFFDLDPTAYIECECGCGQQATDVNHIFCKGMGGSKKWDFIENLGALARSCHVLKGDNKKYFDELVTKHAEKMGVAPEVIYTKLYAVKPQAK